MLLQLKYVVYIFYVQTSKKFAVKHYLNISQLNAVTLQQSTKVFYSIFEKQHNFSPRLTILKNKEKKLKPCFTFLKTFNKKRPAKMNV